ncbi:MAG: HlyD family multidrug efflux protein [Cyanobacteria bacterium RYN_339]|nr:HlyD family multidrug efflux protein [Cyanobacteria bacterium RYN_339]
MHKGYVTFMLVGTIGLGGLFAAGFVPRWQRQAALAAETAHPAIPGVNFVLPTRADAASELTLPGELKAYRETAIYARTTGYLKRRLVDLGDHVREGQLLAEIESPELDKELGAARASLAQARANLVQAQTDMAFARTSFERWQALRKGGNVASQEADEKAAAYRSKQAQVTAVTAAVSASATNVQRLQALTNFERVTAPFAGTITARNVDTGALISPTGGGATQGLFRLVQTDRLRIAVGVPQVDVAAVSSGQAAQVVLRERPEPYPAVVARTAGALDPLTRTMTVEVELANKDGKLLPGMYAQVKLAARHASSALQVPGTTVLNRSEGTLVAVVTADNKIHFQKIKPGRDDGALVEVLEGLKGDERVVVNPGDEVHEGAAVQPVAAVVEKK